MASHANMSRARQIGWLSASLSTQTHKIRQLLGRIADLGVAQAMKPAMFSKFLNLMDQVAAAKDEEIRILSSIEAVEQKHRFRRKNGKLAHPKPNKLLDIDPMARSKEECEEEEEYHRSKRAKIAGFKETKCDEDAMPYDYVPPPTPDRPRYGWFWFLAFWLFVTNNGSNARNQDLTAD